MAVDWNVYYNNYPAGPGWPVDIQGIDGLGDLPEVSTADRPRLRRHGLIAGDDFLGGRTVTVRYVFDQSTSVADLAAMTAALLPCTTEQELGFQIPGVAGYLANGDDGFRTINARVRRRSIPTNLEFRMGLAFADVQFYATDPRIYGSPVGEVAILPITNQGLAFDASFPLSFGGAQFGGSVTMSMKGNFNTEWRAEIRNACTNPRITNNTTGAYLQFNTTLVDGDRLTIDSNTRTCVLNGIVSRYNTIAVGSTWFDLPPGNTPILFRADSYSGTAELHITASPAWM